MAARAEHREDLARAGKALEAATAVARVELQRKGAEAVLEVLARDQMRVRSDAAAVHKAVLGCDSLEKLMASLPLLLQDLLPADACALYLVAAVAPATTIMEANAAKKETNVLPAANKEGVGGAMALRTIVPGGALASYAAKMVEAMLHGGADAPASRTSSSVAADGAPAAIASAAASGEDEEDDDDGDGLLGPLTHVLELVLSRPGCSGAVVASGKGLLAAAARGEAVVACPDVRADARFDREVDEALFSRIAAPGGRAELGGVLCAAVADPSSGRIVAVIQACRARGRRPFGPADADLAADAARAAGLRVAALAAARADAAAARDAGRAASRAVTAAAASLREQLRGLRADLPIGPPPAPVPATAAAPSNALRTASTAASTTAATAGTRGVGQAGSGAPLAEDEGDDDSDWDDGETATPLAEHGATATGFPPAAGRSASGTFRPGAAAASVLEEEVEEEVGAERSGWGSLSVDSTRLDTTRIIERPAPSPAAPAATDASTHSSTVDHPPAVAAMERAGSTAVGRGSTAAHAAEEIAAPAGAVDRGQSRDGRRRLWLESDDDEEEPSSRGTDAPSSAHQPPAGGSQRAGEVGGAGRIATARSAEVEEHKKQSGGRENELGDDDDDGWARRMEEHVASLPSRPAPPFADAAAPVPVAGNAIKAQDPAIEDDEEVGGDDPPPATAKTGEEQGDEVEEDEEEDWSGEMPEMDEVFPEERPAFAAFDYEPVQDDELPLEAGQRLLLVGISQPGWFLARHASGGPSGLVPSNYVTEVL